MKKLRERIGALALRSMLLLAALLALSQTASAWSYYYLRGDGGDNNIHYTEGKRYELTWNEATSSYILENFSVTKEWTFKVVTGNSVNGDDGWYSDSSNQTVSATSFNLARNQSGKFTVSPGKTYNVEVKTDQNLKDKNPIKIIFTETADVDHSSKLELGGNWVEEWANDKRPFSRNSDGSYTSRVENITNGSDLRFKVVYNTNTWVGYSGIQERTGVETISGDDDRFKIVDAPAESGTLIVTVKVNDTGYPIAIAATFEPDANTGTYRLNIYYTDKDGVQKNVRQDFDGTSCIVNNLNLYDRFTVTHILNGVETVYNVTGTGVVADGDYLKLADAQLGRADVTFTVTANENGVPQNLAATLGTVTPFTYSLVYLNNEKPFDAAKNLSVTGFLTTANFLVKVTPSFHGNVSDETTFALSGTNVKQTADGYSRLIYDKTGTADVAFALAVNAAGYPTEINATIDNFQEPTSSDFYLIGQFNGWTTNDPNYNFTQADVEKIDGNWYIKYVYDFPDFDTSHTFGLYYDGEKRNPTDRLENIEREPSGDQNYKLTDAFKATLEDNHVRFILYASISGNYYSFKAEAVAEAPMYAIVVDGREVPMNKAADPNTFTLRFSEQNFPVGSSFQVKRLSDGALFPRSGETLSGSFVKTDGGVLKIDTENLGGISGNQSVTFVLKVDDSGDPVGLSAAVKTDQSSFFLEYNGQKIYFTGSGNRLICTVEGFDLSKEFYLKNGATTYQVTGTNVKKGDSSNSLMIRTEATDRPAVLFTLMLDNQSKPASLSAIRVSAGMPFFPAGITTRQEFREAMNRGDGPFYYLSGHGLNNGLVSPEWQLIKESDTRYVCDFTFNRHDHTATDLSNGNWGNLGPNTITVQKFVNCAATQPVLDWNAGDRSALAASAPQSGKRWRAVYNPQASSNKLTFVPLKYNAETKEWEETTEADATELPFIALIGNEWKQKDTYTIAYQPEDRTTDAAWQDAWIQYGADGLPVLSRTYGEAYYNTQWPPKNPIMFNVDINGTNFGLNSRNLTFTTTGQTGSAAAWKEDPRFANYKDQLNLEAGHDYVLYQVDNVWVKGNWKLWSGWTGAHYKGKDAGWDMNWNWGHKGGSNENQDPYQIGINETVELGLNYGDMYLEDADQPRYLSHIYFFLDTKEAEARAQNKSYSRIFTTESLGGAQIMARSNQDYTGGLFNPTIKDLKEGVTVKSVEIVAKSVVNDNVVANLSIADVPAGTVNNNETFRAIFRKPVASYAPDYFEGGRSYSHSGWYYYEMTVKFSQGDDAVVTSNPYWIAVDNENLFTAQLVEVQNGAVEGYKYVTGSDPSATEAYGVNVAEDGTTVTEFKKLASVPSADFYGDRTKALWTNKMIVFAPRPWADDDQTTEMPNSRMKEWILTVNGVDEPTEFTDPTADGTNADYLRIFDINDAGVQTFEMKLSYWPGKADGSVDTETVIGPMHRGSVSTYLRVPNPRLQNKFTVEKWRDENAVSTPIKVDQPDENGVVKTQEYPNVRLRHHSVTLYVDMPNATQDLLSVIPEDKKLIKVKFTDNAWMAGYIGTSQLDLSQADVTGKGATISFVDMPTGSWLFHNGETYEGVERHLSMTFPTGDNSPVRWYDRPRHGVDVKFMPHLEAPTLAADGAGMKVYRYKAQVPDKHNAWKEYIVMATPPTITPAQHNVLHQGNAPIVHIPEHAHYAMQINGKMYPRYQLIEELENEAVTYTVAESAECTWYAEMDQDKWIIAPELKLALSHVYFFDSTNPTVKGDGTFVTATGLTKQQRAARAAAYAAEGEETGPAPSFIPFTPLFAHTIDLSEELQKMEIATSVQEVEGEGAVVLSGAGFIHLLTEGAVYTVDGRCVFTGQGRVDVAPGIYVVATPKASYKMVVK